MPCASLVPCAGLCDQRPQVGASQYPSGSRANRDEDSKPAEAELNIQAMSERLPQGSQQMWMQEHAGAEQALRHRGYLDLDAKCRRTMRELPGKV
eukprot:496796-Pelagomonas_calceolata.AAC.2